MEDSSNNRSIISRATAVTRVGAVDVMQRRDRQSAVCRAFIGSKTSLRRYYTYVAVRVEKQLGSRPWSVEEGGEGGRWDGWLGGEGMDDS